MLKGFQILRGGSRDSAECLDWRAAGASFVAGTVIRGVMPVVCYRSLMDCLWGVPFGDHNLQGSLHLNRSRALTQMGQQQEAAQDTACAHIGSRFLRDPCVGSSVACKYKGDQR